MSGIVRIKDLDTAEELTSGDYLAVDSAGEGLRKVPLKPITDDISDLKSALEAIEPGLSDDAKEALLACFAHVAWTDEHGQNYYDALDMALHVNNIDHITATLSLGTHKVYTTDNVQSLRCFLVVKAITVGGSENVVTSYELSGDISSTGIKTITVQYSGKTTTFSVTVETNSTGIVYEWDFTKGLADLRQYKQAVLGTGEKTTYPDYTGETDLPVGTVPPTLSASGLTFNNASQWCRLLDLDEDTTVYLANKTVQVDVSQFSYAPSENYTIRFIVMGDPTARWDSTGLKRFKAGFGYKNNYGWAYYDGYAWNDSIFTGMSDRTAISGHKISLYFNNFRYPKLYVDGISKGTGNKNHSHTLYGLQIGSGDVDSEGGCFYNALITGVRIYNGEVAN